MVQMIYFMALFGAADFVTGRDWFSKVKLPGRSIYYVAPLLCLALWKFWPLGLAWALWRSVLGWSSFGGSMDVTTLKQLWGETVRDSVSSAFVVVVEILAFSMSMPRVGCSCFAFLCVSLTLAIVYGWFVKVRNQDVGPWIELIRGLAFGLIFGLAL